MGTKTEKFSIGTLSVFPLHVRNTLVIDAENVGDLNVCCGILRVARKLYVSGHDFLC